MNVGDILHDKYRIEKFIGRGGIGTVYLCTNMELGNRWAVKHIPAEKVSEKTMAEIEILKKLYHISLPRVVDVFRNEEGLYIVESNIEGISLDKLLQRYGSFSGDKVTDWSLELCGILKYLHGVRPKPIIYRDMKPANIMLTGENRLVLVDFGTSKEYCEYQLKDAFLGGTSAYAAPEQLVMGGVTDQRTDIFNLGATMYHLLHGKLPKGKNGGHAPGKGKAVEQLNAIIGKCMENRPEDRYQKVEEIQKELQSIRDFLVVKKIRQGLLTKLELASAVILSIISYVTAALGLINCR